MTLIIVILLLATLVSAGAIFFVSAAFGVTGSIAWIVCAAIAQVTVWAGLSYIISKGSGA